MYPGSVHRVLISGRTGYTSRRVNSSRAPHRTTLLGGDRQRINPTQLDASAFRRDPDFDISDREGRAAFEPTGGVLQRTLRVLREISFVSEEVVLSTESMGHLPVSRKAVVFGHE